MKNTIESYFNKNQLHEIAKEVAHNKPKVIYPGGPLNKSDETKLFEEIIKDLLSDAKEGKSERVKLEIINNEAFLVREGKNINLHELLPKVNFNHLSLSEQDTADYSQYVASKHKTLSPGEYDVKIDTYYGHMDLANNDTARKEKEAIQTLTYGEKQAITIYTSMGYFNINAVLRNQTVSNHVEPEEALASLLHAAVASHGLNKLPDVELPHVVRVQDKYNLEELIENAAQHKVSQDSAFVSTTEDFASLNPQAFSSDVRIIYENVKGKKVAAISDIEKENEYLLPPSTQLKWTGHKEENGVHYFTAQGANVLINQVEPIEKRVTTAIEQIDNLVEAVSNLITDKEQSSLSADKPTAEPQYTVTHSTPNFEFASIPQPEEFISHVVNIAADNRLIGEDNIREYISREEVGSTDSNYSQDSQQFANATESSFLSVKTKLYNLIGAICTHLGIKSLGSYFFDKAKHVHGQEVGAKSAQSFSR